MQSETASVDIEVAASYPGLIKTIYEGGFIKQQIFNVDKPDFCWMVPFRTFIARRDVTAWLQSVKDRLTLLLWANVIGDSKLKPILIYHFENFRGLKNYANSILLVLYKMEQQSLDDSTCIYNMACCA